MRKLSLVLTGLPVITGVMLLAGQLAAGILSPGLELYLADLNASDEVTVMLALREQAAIAELDRTLRVEHASLAERHARVVGALQETAAATQNGLISELEQLRSAGQVAGWSSHWLSNLVVVRGTVATVRELAAREDVDRAEVDLFYTMIEPVAVAAEKQASATRGVQPGVDNIEADRVWYELGIFGEGALVGGIDTGVMGSHEAFADRWQGNFAPSEEAWLDLLSSSSYPSDGNGHGTHTMGTMVGTSPDTIGVAPGARWIATNPINQGASEEFDNDIIVALEWLADPDGDPETVDDVPDVVQNSWRVNENFSGYYDCDSRWWEAIDNCEAAGVVLTWSAGNEGPGFMTIGSPADRADTPYNCFSIGSTLRYPPFTISGFSSRGPSGCGGPYAVKPEVVAPGSDIYSAYNDGGYTVMSGTSMAGPHVAGVVALIRCANPDLDVASIKQVLMETAMDLGDEGEDNIYGWGIVNAYDAVVMVLEGYGAATGTVSNSATGLPIPGAQVCALNGPQTDDTDADGVYQLYLAAGTHHLGFSAFGYLPDSALVEVPADGEVVQDMALAPAPEATLSGCVYDPVGQPVADATVTILDTPLEPVYTAGNGFYTLQLPIGAIYTTVAQAEGFAADQEMFLFTGDMTIDFQLAELTVEDFESGDFEQLPWEPGGGAADWFISGDAGEGSWCAQSGDVSDNQASRLEVTLSVTATSEISFMYRVSSEAGYDFLRFYVDDAELAAWSGQQDWDEFNTTVSSGEHTFSWVYEKDYSVSNGSDCGWVDYIVFPALGDPPPPDIAVTPVELTAAAPPGELTTETLSIANVGAGDLDFTIEVITDGLPTTVETMQLPKGAPDPRPGQFDREAGGPDGYGNYWIDSDEPGGPVFDWIEINEVGAVLPPLDEGNFGPVYLGFDFNFYGTFHNTVYICTNGWLSFTDTGVWDTNQGIPNPGEPNNLIAPFWDDLNPTTGGTIYYFADTANDRFIVEWDAVNHFYSGNPETFQVILHTDGRILFQYHTLSSSGNCTVGIENQTGSDGLPILFNDSYLYDGLAILISNGLYDAWLSATPISGSVEPFDACELTVTFNAADLTEGIYTGTVNVHSNDPDEAVLGVPVSFIVGDAWLPAVDDLSIHLSGDELILTWSPVEGATFYQLWQATEPWGDYIEIGSTTGCMLVLPLTEEQRFYRVVAGN